MKITAVEVYRKDLPLDEPIKYFSAGTVTALEEVYVILRTGEGLSGYGEVRGNSHYLTGDTPDRVTSETLGYLAPRLLGCDPRDLNAILAELDGAVIGLHGAKSGIDIALHDLAAKAHGVSVFELLGGAVRDELPSNQTLWYGPPEAAAQKAAAYVAEGFRYIKVRAGLRPFEKDVDRIRAVREAIGEDISLAIDPNMGWEAREAVRYLRKLERFNLSYVEQPVSHTDFAGMRHVTRNAGIPVMADESIQSISDVFVLARDRAADILHLKLIKLGGIDGVRRAPGGGGGRVRRPPADGGTDERGGPGHDRGRPLRPGDTFRLSGALRIPGIEGGPHRGIFPEGGKGHVSHRAGPGSRSGRERASVGRDHGFGLKAKPVLPKIYPVYLWRIGIAKNFSGMGGFSASHVSRRVRTGARGPRVLRAGIEYEIRSPRDE